MQRNIYKSTGNRMLFGVCGGLAEYLKVDATLIRIITLVLLFTGSGFLVYIIGAIIIPEAPMGYNPYEDTNKQDVEVFDKDGNKVHQSARQSS